MFIIVYMVKIFLNLIFIINIILLLIMYFLIDSMMAILCMCNLRNKFHEDVIIIGWFYVSKHSYLEIMIHYITSID